MVADRVLDQIIKGELLPGESLPPEAELASSHSVSRLTIREAIKALEHIGVIEVHRGNGTFVCDSSRWSPLEPRLLDARVRTKGARDSVRLLLETRRIIERGAAELAALRRTEDDLAAMRDAISRMEATREAASFAAADLDFHTALFAAGHNAYLGALLQPVRQLLIDHRVLTSSTVAGRHHGIAAHRSILAAVEARDVDGAGGEMAAHIDQTITDVMRSGPSESQGRRAQ